MYKGIILAGGTGSRLFPITNVISKQLLPVYDKPMIFYPLSILMILDIKDILIITTCNDIHNFQKLLGNGNQFGINIQYAIQDKPNGIAQAFIIGEQFIGNDDVCLILGDNIFYSKKILNCILNKNNATILAYSVCNPENYGVIELDDNLKPISIEEKPKNPKSNYIITGLYFYPNDVIEISKNLKPSNRNEYEISDVNQRYLSQNRLNVEIINDINCRWFDTGTPESLLDAANFMKKTINSQKIQIGCIHEIAWKKKWITTKQLMSFVDKYKNTKYGQYISELIK